MLITNGSGFSDVSCEESFHGQWELQKKVNQESSPGTALLEASLGFSNKGCFSGAQFLLCPEKENDVYMTCEQNYIKEGSTSIN